MLPRIICNFHRSELNGQVCSVTHQVSATMFAVKVYHTNEILCIDVKCLAPIPLKESDKLLMLLDLPNVLYDIQPSSFSEKYEPVKKRQRHDK